MTTDILRYLYSLQKSGMKFGLQNISLLLAGAGNPHQTFPSIHIAGTNGKGSTSSMLSSVLTAAGYRTGLFTSPHLVSFAERIRIDGRPISEKRIIEYTALLKPAIDKLNVTFFEAATALAFLHFARERVDVAVIEVGLGGRLDSTNVITPLLSMITTIGYDHMEYLGNTLQSIAAEKAGIMKTPVPCLTAETKEEVLGTLQRIARRRSVPFMVERELADHSITHAGLDGSLVTLDTPFRTYRDLSIALPGIHQISNASLAVLAAEYLSSVFRIPQRSIREGLANIRKLSGLHGRMEVVRRKPLVVVDVAHNPHGMESSVRSLLEFGQAHFIVVFGVMKDKDHGRMLRILKPITELLIATQPDTARALPSGDIVSEAKTEGMRILQVKSPSAAFERAVDRAERARLPVLVIGSHYLAGELIQKKCW